jgi:hypothetical protein
MGLSGPSQEEIWRQLSQEIGAEYVEGRFLKLPKVQAHVVPWTVTLDTFSGEDVTLTRMRAPYVNPAGLRFAIYRKGPLSGLGKLLRMQDIEVGDPEFDEAFVIKGNDEGRVRELFANPKIRQIIQAQPAFILQVQHIQRRLFGPPVPKDVDQLYFHVVGVIKDVARLKALFDLFAAVLDQLCRIGSASKQEPGVEL